MRVVSQSCKSEAAIQTHSFPSRLSVKVMLARGTFIKHFKQNCFSINLQHCKIHSKTCAVFKHVQFWRFKFIICPSQSEGLAFWNSPAHGNLLCPVKPADKRNQKDLTGSCFAAREKKERKRRLAACFSSFRVTAPPTGHVSRALIPEQTHYFLQCCLNSYFKY